MSHRRILTLLLDSSYWPVEPWGQRGLAQGNIDIAQYCMWEFDQQMNDKVNSLDIDFCSCQTNVEKVPDKSEIKNARLALEDEQKINHHEGSPHSQSDNWSRSNGSHDDSPLDNSEDILKKVDEIVKYISKASLPIPNPLRGVSRRRLYYVRHDVIAKILFRSLRKYYFRKFSAFFDYSNCEWKDNSDTQGELLVQLNEFLDARFGLDRPPNMTFF